LGGSDTLNVRPAASATTASPFPLPGPPATAAAAAIGAGAALGISGDASGSKQKTLEGHYRTWMKSLAFHILGDCTQAIVTKDLLARFLDMSQWSQGKDDNAKREQLDSMGDHLRFQRKSFPVTAAVVVKQVVKKYKNERIEGRGGGSSKKQMRAEKAIMKRAMDG